MHHFHEWAGSELFALEIYEDLRRRNLTVNLFSPFVNPVFAQSALENWRHIITEPSKINLASYDLVIVLHQTASRFLHLQDQNALLGTARPVFAYFHLSPTEPFEAPGLFGQKLFADMVYANSEETRAQLSTYGLTNVEVFENPAPDRFTSTRAPSETLQSLLSVSSHLPHELAQAFEILSASGVTVYRIGKPENPRRVRPYDICDHDAVVTIGKTVQYALRGKRAVFCYDHYQGPGWIGPDFAETAQTNFSGRTHRIRRTPEQLAADIIDGYQAATAWVQQSGEAASARYKLEHKLDDLIGKVRGLKARDLTSMDFQDVQRHLYLESKVYELVDRGYETTSRVLSPAVARPTAPPQPDLPITRHSLRDPAPDEAKVIAMFSFRHEAHLVPGLLENIGPAIHGYVSWDDRQADADEIFSDESLRQTALFQAAKAMGAEWVLAVDPDERFEDRLADDIKTMTTQSGPVVWTFECREMFHPTKYRIDGPWGLRSRARLFPCILGMEPDQQKLHGSWTRNALRLAVKHSGLNFYHLRMISPNRRSLRAKQYAVLDPDRINQNLGYDYLDDENGMVLQDIPEGRGYSPPHVDDNAHWQPVDSEGLSGPVAPDPMSAKLHRLKTTWARGGYANAMHLAREIWQDNPDDQEFGLWAADSAMRAGLWQAALEMAQPVAQADGESLMARLIMARSHMALGNRDDGAAALEQAEALAPGSLFCAQLREMLYPAPERFSNPDALWRRWVDGPAEIFEGSRIATCGLSVVVLSLGAPPELATAVASLCRQSIVPEIVVVNSGGGDVLGRLAAMRDRVRIITTSDRLFAGAVRNIGIDASLGAYVSFLASDCTALPGSIQKRLEKHRSGARAVSAFVVPQDSTSVCQNAAAFLLHSSRNASSGLPGDQKYSLSYDRSIFEDFGYFPPGLRVGEDTYLNRTLANVVEIASDKAIGITHSYAPDLADLTRDMTQRARRRVRSMFFPRLTTNQQLRQHVNNAFDVRLAAASKALASQRTMFAPETLVEIQQLVTELLEVERQVTYSEGLDLVRVHQKRAAAIGCHADAPYWAAKLMREAIHDFPQLPIMYQTQSEFLAQSAPNTAAQEISKLLETAAAIDPANPHILLGLMDWCLGSGQETEACRHFERGCLAAPRRPDIWQRHAPLPGDANRPMRVYSLQRMFFLDPFDRGTAQTIAENYRHAGHQTAQAARVRFAERFSP
jgi:hypothetical protein